MFCFDLEYEFWTIFNILKEGDFLHMPINPVPP